jgi:kinesin family protein 6/9
MSSNGHNSLTTKSNDPPPTTTATTKNEEAAELIKIFVRLKPSKRPSSYIKVAMPPSPPPPPPSSSSSPDEDNDKKTRPPLLLPQRLAFDVPQDVATTGYVNNNKTQHRFSFTGVLGLEATQDQVFACIGQDAVRNVLEGNFYSPSHSPPPKKYKFFMPAHIYIHLSLSPNTGYNGTCFAYGQTNSGKTFSITGGPARYADRGLIPRALQMLFQEMKKNTKKKAMQYQVYVSYMEVYNEVGYDLLHDATPLAGGGAGAATSTTEEEDGEAEQEGHEEGHQQTALPRVHLLADEDGNCHLKGLSMHLVATEEEALNLLFVGDTNRAISETAMNKASSRSHCLFTVSLESRSPGRDKVRRSKLNMVDLAGSERVHKTSVRGQTLKEAKYINQSLFYLEMVILALHEKRAHVPYRNSLLTTVLRDSLGGNCKTVMIATIATDKVNTEESLSTCRFAMRVGQIRNEAKLNEDLDPYQVIRRLQTELSTAKAEVGFLKGGEGKGLTEGEKDEIEQACRDYVSVGGERKKGHGEEEGVDEKSNDSGLCLAPPLTLSKVQFAFHILRGMVWKASAATAATASTAAITALGGLREVKEEAEKKTQKHEEEKGEDVTRGQRSAKRQQAPRPLLPPPSCEAAGARPPLAEVLQDPTTALSYFRSHHYPHRVGMEEDQRLLKTKYVQAKALGEEVQQTRESMTCLRKMVEQVRRWKEEEEEEEEEGDGEGEGKGGGKGKTNAVVEEEEAKLLRELEQKKASYQHAFQSLRVLKGEIEGIQRGVERHRARLQVAFDAWFAKAGASGGGEEREGRDDGDDDDDEDDKGGGQEEEEGEEEGETQQQDQARAPACISAPRKSSFTSSLPLPSSFRGVGVGVGEVEDDIAAFYKAKDDVLALRQQQQQQQEGGRSGWD